MFRFIILFIVFKYQPESNTGNSHFFCMSLFIYSHGKTRDDDIRPRPDL